ncbi:MFS transporter [Pectobacterium wasabiae]|uniref:MFS transporter n=1 Tax=Pectobacterium wasabiae TaxID=55208 RepID=A0AAW3EFT0_9GAMM|nr:MFS transporter [Pectobacterium wasabiae]AOR62732.1 MFS transporter [Pectobacterium wasabiae CFBP 3304]EJS95609.1 Y4xM [Pectobacterium wasabiae CFBP 3304]KFX04536.1 MFS transporter [Pectobacterium wasabiae]KGA27556.1 MFS transporter [Pectobacterium wasabiae]
MRLSGQAAFIIHFMFVVQLVAMGAMEMSGPFWPLHLESMSSGAELSIAGIAVYIGPMLGIMLTSAFWGRMGDRLGNKAMMIRALFGLALTQLGLAWANDIWMIVALRFIQGACAGYIAPAQAYGVAVVSPLQRTRLFAWLQVSTNVGSLLGAIVGGLILDYLNFFWINLSAAILCALCGITVALFLPHVVPVTSTVPTKDAQVKDVPRKRLWVRSPIPALLLISGLLLTSRMIPQTPFSLYMDGFFQVDKWVIGLCYGLQATGVIVSASLWARYFENLSLQQTLSRLCVVMLACAIVTLTAATMLNIAIFIPLYFLWGVLLGATTPVLMALISRAAGAGQQGFILGVAQSVSQFASILGISLGGLVLYSPGLRSLFFCVGAAYLVTFLVALVLLRRLRRQAEKHDSLSTKGNIENVY